MVEIAWAASRTRNTFYSARYHRIAARRGKKRALLAIGHSILKSVYHILLNTEEYRELGAEYVLQRVEAKRKAYLKSELVKLGFHVELQTIPKPA